MASTCTLITLAHTGGGESFLAGLTHPLFGLDHLLAMVTVGLLAVRLAGPGEARDRRALWLIPAAFLAAMAVGGLLAGAGAPLPAIEHLIALSVLGLGLMVALLPRVSALIGAGIVAAAAVGHGYAHVAEIGAHVAGGYFAGMLLTTAGLHGAGIGIGWLLTRAHQWPIRLAGAAVTALFAVLLILP